MTAQFYRLEKDVDELNNYIEKVKRRGNNSGLVNKLLKKKEFLIKHITEKKTLMQ